MTTTYIYAPYTSWVTQLNTSGHIACSGGTNLIDMGAWGSEWSSVKVYASSNTNSIRFTRKTCCPCNNNTNNAVKAEFWTGYNATGCLLGWVLYGHLAWPVANGVWNSNWGIHIGYIVPPPAGCTCYTGASIHMESSNHGTLLLSTLWQQVGARHFC